MSGLLTRLEPYTAWRSPCTSRPRSPKSWCSKDGGSGSSGKRRSSLWCCPMWALQPAPRW